MQKILIVIPNLNHAGGTERAAINLANMLADNYVVTILSLTRQTSKMLFSVDKQVNVIYCHIAQNNSGIIGKAKWLYQCYLRIDESIKKYNIDTVIGLTHNINSVISLFKRKNVNTIACEHIDYTTIPNISRKIIERLYPYLDAIVTLSNQGYENIKHLNKNIVIIPNPLSFQVKNESSLSSHRILMVGRLSKEKGLERIIPLAKYLIRNHPQWYIDIYGDGDSKVEIESMIKQHMLTNLKIHTPVQDIKSEYLQSSIFLSTSYTEALPMTFLEAMHSGLPIISYKHSGSDSLIINNVNGIVVENENQFIKQTVNLIEDKELRKKLGRNGRKFSLEFTPQKIKQQWLSLLKSLSNK